MTDKTITAEELDKRAQILIGQGYPVAALDCDRAAYTIREKDAEIAYLKNQLDAAWDADSGMQALVDKQIAEIKRLKEQKIKGQSAD